MLFIADLVRACQGRIVTAVVERKDVEAALQARRELGAEYEPQIVDSIVEKIEQRLRERPATAPRNHYYELRLALGWGGCAAIMAGIVLAEPAAGRVLVSRLDTIRLRFSQ